MIYLLVNTESLKKKDTWAHISHTELITTNFESQYLKCKRASLPRMLPISHACLTVAFPVPTPEASLQAGRKYRSINISGEPESTTQFAAPIINVCQVALIPPDTRSDRQDVGISSAPARGQSAQPHGTRCMLKVHNA